MADGGKGAAAPNQRQGQNHKIKNQLDSDIYI